MGFRIILIFEYFVANPLADGFDIMLGSYIVKVPNVTPGPYQILGKRYAPSSVVTNVH